MSSHSPFSQPCHPEATVGLLSVCGHLWTLDASVGGIMHYLAFWNWLLSLSVFKISSCCSGLPRWSVLKTPPANAGDIGSVPELIAKIPGEGNSNPLQYSCLRNPMDRGAWWATVHGAAAPESDLTEHMSTLQYLSVPHIFLLQVILYG